MAASMWSNKLKDHYLKVRHFGNICHKKTVQNVQRRKLMKNRQIYCSSASVVFDKFNDLVSKVSPSLQNELANNADCNFVCRLSCGRMPFVAHTFGAAVKMYPVHNLVCAGVQKRWCSSGSDRPDEKPFELMDFPPIVWPSPIKTIKNWILARLIITPYFDIEFNLADFSEGSKQAVEVVSKRLSEADFDSLQGLVTPEAISELRRSIADFSLQRRLELALSAEDLYFCFPHQVGIMFTDKDQRRYVEITMCYHALRGLKELREQSINPPINMGIMPEYQDKLFICNYRFLREYTRGVNDQWTINVANHFRPS